MTRYRSILLSSLCALLAALLVVAPPASVLATVTTPEAATWDVRGSRVLLGVVDGTDPAETVMLRATADGYLIASPTIAGMSTADLDTGAGTQTASVVGLRVAKSGGAALVGAGAAGDPLPITLDGEAVVLGAGTAEVGKLAAGLANIGNVDLASIGAAGVIDTEVTAISADADVEAATANLRILGFSAVSTAGAVAILRHDTVGTTCDGPVVAYLSLTAATPITVNFGDRGRAVASGLCVDRVSGTVDGFSAHLVVEAAP